MIRLVNVFFILLFINFSTTNYLSSDCFINQDENKVLEIFFRTLIEESETGYVLHNIKPMCINGFYAKDTFYVNSPTHRQTVALREGSRIWKGLNIPQKDIIIHISNKEDPLIPNYIHILSINKNLFKKVVNDNLLLFQYILGTKTSAENLLEAFLSRNNTYYTLLKKDKVLTGILLGFGIENSLCVSRIENILELTEQTTLPFLIDIKHNKSNVNLAFGCGSIFEELTDLQNNILLSSEKLCNEKPNFVFGWVKDSKKNQDLILELEAVQKKIQFDLSSKFFLADTLQKITEQKNVNMINQTFRFDFQDKNINNIIAKGLWEHLQNYSYDFIPFFIDYLDMPKLDIKIAREALFPSYIDDILEAKSNLEKSKIKFQELEKNPNYSVISPYNIYYKIVSYGQEDIQKKHNSIVTLDYTIYSPENFCLEKQLSKTLDLNDTIPGFALGVKDMRLNEVREIFIPPSYAYGFDTSLDKCIYLRVIVKLVGISQEKEDKLKPIQVLNLSSYDDPNYIFECKNKYICALKSFSSKIGEHLEKHPQIDLTVLKGLIKNFFLNKEKVSLTDEERDIINQIHWNIYFG